MRCVGFSTGALAKGDFRLALHMLEDKNVCALELSALRQDELLPLVEQLDNLNLSAFKYVSFHAPSSMTSSFEDQALEVLEQVARRSWPIVVHPDAMLTVPKWARLGDSLCIENMDKRKPIGQTASDLAKVFEVLPRASLCFDIGHARQVDPTMSEASEILVSFREKIKQLHVSEVNSNSQHDRLSFESVLAFRKVSHLIPSDVPVILESRVEELAIDEEVRNAIDALSKESLLAVAGD
jgi:hypothetical protein